MYLIPPRGIFRRSWSHCVYIHILLCHFCTFHKWCQCYDTHWEVWSQKHEKHGILQLAASCNPGFSEEFKKYHSLNKLFEEGQCLWGQGGVVGIMMRNILKATTVGFHANKHLHTFVTAYSDNFTLLQGYNILVYFKNYRYEFKHSMIIKEMYFLFLFKFN